MQHPTFAARADGQSGYRRSPRTSSAVRDAFMARWLEYLPRRGGFVERFNHGYPLRGGATAGRTLEIGAGLGAHIEFENLERPAVLRRGASGGAGGEPGRAIPDRDDARRRLPGAPSVRRRVLRSRARDPRPRAPARPPGGARRGRARPRSRWSIRRRHPVRRWARRIRWRGASPHSGCSSASSVATTTGSSGTSTSTYPGRSRASSRSGFASTDSRYFPFRVPSVKVNLVIGLTMHPLA